MASWTSTHSGLGTSQPRCHFPSLPSRPPQINVVFDTRLNAPVRERLRRRFSRRAWPLGALMGLAASFRNDCCARFAFHFGVPHSHIRKRSGARRHLSRNGLFTLLLSNALPSLMPASIVWPLHSDIRFLRLFVGSAALLSAAIIFGRNIYPLVPTWFGAGQADTVTIDLADGSRFCSDCNSVELIDEDAQRIVVLVHDGSDREHAVALERSAIRCVSHSSVLKLRCL
jgi:hypothetical protein